jgi:hypothetical protein
MAQHTYFCFFELKGFSLTMLPQADLELLPPQPPEC